MIAQLLIWPLFAATCFAALARPWLGLVGFYFFAVLDPGWNWRWLIPHEFPFQFYIAVSVLSGIAMNGLSFSSLKGDNKWPLAGLAGFLGLTFLASFGTLSPELSLFYVRSIWRIIIMASLTMIVIDAPYKIRCLITAVVLAQGYNALQLNLQYFQDGYSLFSAGGWAWGAKGDNNGYTLYTIPVLAMSLSLATFDKSNWLRLTGLCVGLLQIHQVMLLESRGGMLGVLLLGILFVYFVPKTKINISSIAAIILIGFVLAGPSVLKEFMSSFESRDNLDRSASSRYELWKAGLAITADHPWLGVGPWAGSMLVPQYYEGELAVTRKELHNLLFELSCGVGVPATLLYFSYFWLSWWWCVSLMRSKSTALQDDPILRTACLAVACGIPGYLLASMFSSGSLLETSYILASTGCAVKAICDIVTASTESHDEEDSEALPRHIQDGQSERAVLGDEC